MHLQGNISVKVARKGQFSWLLQFFMEGWMDGKLDAEETTGKGESECKLESVSLSLRDFAGPYFI